MRCVACRLGRKWECEYHGKCSDDSVDSDSSSKRNDSSHPLENLFLPEGSSENAATGTDVEYIPGKPSREIDTYKEDSALRDQQSTGRKRAALMYPLFPDEPCEWSGKKNVGGNKPIVGCISGKQQARHHGPDKNTLNNEEGNVHRICHNCHNRWHTLNDPDYVWGTIYDGHSPVIATPRELLENQMYWATRSVVKAKD